MRLALLPALLILATPVLAQEQQAIDAADTGAKPAKAKKDKNDPNRVICKRVGQTGTMLGGKQECHTKAEWDKVTEDSRRTLEGRNVGQGNN